MKTVDIDGKQYRIGLLDSERHTVCEFCAFYHSAHCPELKGALKCTDHDEGAMMGVFINDTPEAIAEFIARRMT